MSRFLTKPAPVDAVQWTGDNWPEVCEFVAQQCSREHYAGWPSPSGTVLRMPLGSRERDAVPGDWIVRDARGELCPVSPLVFEREYTRG